MAEDPTKRGRRAFLGSVGLAAGAVASLSGCLDRGPDPEEQLRQHESDVEPLGDVATAVDEGYQTAVGYSGPGDRGIGLSVLNGDVSEIDPKNPHVVRYDLTESGGYEPLGVSWIASAADHDEPPTLFDTEFSGPYEAREPFLPRHYALHAWLFRDNPDGVFATSHPQLDPPGYIESLGPVWDRLRAFASGQDAESAGYENTEKCIDGESGGYGVPFVDGGTETTDETSPPVMLYLPTANWAYRLLGAEWYVEAAETDEPPSMYGQQFHAPMDGHSPKTDQPRHYGLHAWLFRVNPAGLFAPFNPAVRC